MIIEVPLSLIDANQNNRSIGDVAPLAESIRKAGLLQPPVLIRKGERFLVVAGHRRLAAVALLGWKECRCSVVDPDTNVALCRLIENVARLDLAPHELVSSVTAVVESGERVKDVAEGLGLSVSYIRNLVSVRTRLIPDAWNLFEAQGRKAKIADFINLSYRPPVVQLATIRGEKAPEKVPQEKGKMRTRLMVSAKHAKLSEHDPRKLTLGWVLGLNDWPEFTG